MLLNFRYIVHYSIKNAENLETFLINRVKYINRNLMFEGYKNYYN